jgi:putative transposase
MANTYSQIYIQVVFAVYGRENLIKPEWKDEIYKYISGIVKNKKQKLIAINGVSDHVHILLGIKPNCDLSHLVQEIKANSSRFINDERFVHGRFNWQEGFGAFSYGYSQLDTVIGYIQRQEEHHKKKSFREEYLGFLEKFQVNFDEKYLFEWVE